MVNVDHTIALETMETLFTKVSEDKQIAKNVIESYLNNKTSKELNLALDLATSGLPDNYNQAKEKAFAIFDLIINVAIENSSAEILMLLAKDLAGLLCGGDTLTNSPATIGKLMYIVHEMPKGNWVFVMWDKRMVKESDGWKFIIPGYEEKWKGIIPNELWMKLVIETEQFNAWKTGFKK